MCAALGCGILYTRQARLQQTISDKVLRFHVLANSDSEDVYKRQIYQSTGNPKLVNMLNNLREQMYRYRVEYLKDENNYPTLMKEHKDIVEGLVRKNKTQVTETMHQHVKNQAVAVKAMIQEQE